MRKEVIYAKDFSTLKKQQSKLLCNIRDIILSVKRCVMILSKLVLKVSNISNERLEDVLAPLLSAILSQIFRRV